MIIMTTIMKRNTGNNFDKNNGICVDENNTRPHDKDRESNKK